MDESSTEFEDHPSSTEELSDMYQYEYLRATSRVLGLALSEQKTGREIAQRDRITNLVKY